MTDSDMSAADPSNVKESLVAGEDHAIRRSLSICICTYNRADYLREMLASLLPQEFMVGDEVLVINNNSADETPSVIAEYQSRLPIREVFEVEQGLSRARNRALRESKGEAVLFFDDDVLLNSNVVNAYREAILEQPKHGFFGGKINIAWPHDIAPQWWSDSDFALLDGLLVHYDLGASSTIFSLESRLPYGASFALTRSTINEIGEFDPNLGVSGAEIGRGEESDYFTRALSAGIVGSYVPNAIIAHRFEPKRLKWPYLVRYGIAKSKFGPRRNIFSGVYLAFVQLLRGVIQLLLGRKGNALQCAIMIGIYIGETMSNK